MFYRGLSDSAEYWGLKYQKSGDSVKFNKIHQLLTPISSKL